MQQMYSCPNCGGQVVFGVKFCPNCGTSLNWPTQQTMQPPPVYQEQKYSGGWEQNPALPQNTSGQGKGGVIPPEIKGWNWGAFFLSWIWGIGNRVWIALIVFIPVPFLALIMALVLGAKGTEWAWQSKRWDSIEHFRKTQRTWAYWGLGLVLAPLVIWFLGLFAYFVYDTFLQEVPPTIPYPAEACESEQIQLVLAQAPSYNFGHISIITDSEYCNTGWDAGDLALPLNVVSESYHANHTYLRR